MTPWHATPLPLPPTAHWPGLWLTEFSGFNPAVRIPYGGTAIGFTWVGSGSFLVLSLFRYYETVHFTLDFSDRFLFMKSISFEMRLKMSPLKKLSVYSEAKPHGAGTWDAFLHMVSRREGVSFAADELYTVKKSWNKKIRWNANSRTKREGKQSENLQRHKKRKVKTACIITHWISLCHN